MRVTLLEEKQAQDGLDMVNFPYWKVENEDSQVSQMLHIKLGDICFGTL